MYQGLLPSLPQYMVSALSEGSGPGPLGGQQSAPAMGSPSRLHWTWECVFQPLPPLSEPLWEDCFPLGRTTSPLHPAPGRSRAGCLRVSSCPDCAAEDPAGCSSHLKGQNRLDQHPSGRPARGDAVSAVAPVKGAGWGSRTGRCLHSVPVFAGLLSFLGSTSL